MIPEPSFSILTSKPGPGVAQRTDTPDEENWIAVVPPTREKVLVSLAAAGTVGAVEVLVELELAADVDDEVTVVLGVDVGFDSFVEVDGAAVIAGEAVVEVAFVPELAARVVVLVADTDVDVRFAATDDEVAPALALLEAADCPTEATALDGGAMPACVVVLSTGRLFVDSTIGDSVLAVADELVDVAATSPRVRSIAAAEGGSCIWRSTTATPPHTTAIAVALAATHNVMYPRILMLP